MSVTWIVQSDAGVGGVARGADGRGAAGVTMGGHYPPAAPVIDDAAVSVAAVSRPIPAVLVALAVSAVGAVILGEYELAGVRPILAGLLFGVTIAEVMVTVARRADPWLWAAAALVTQAGLLWATWISTGHDLSGATATAWLGIVVGAAAAPTWLKSADQRAARTQAERAPAPGD